MGIFYIFLNTRFRSIQCTVATRYAKTLSNFSFPSERYKAIKVWRCKQTTAKGFQTCLYCIYLFKLYDMSIIMLLTSDLTNICRKISKIRLILWMAYTRNVKGFKKVTKIWKMNVLCIVGQNHQRWAIVVDHSSKFKAI